MLKRPVCVMRTKRETEICQAPGTSLDSNCRPDILWKSLAVLNAVALGANNSVQHSFYLCYPLDLDPMSMMAGHYTVPYGRQKCCIDGLGDCVCGRPASKSQSQHTPAPSCQQAKFFRPPPRPKYHPQPSLPLQKSTLQPPIKRQKEQLL